MFKRLHNHKGNKQIGPCGAAIAGQLQQSLKHLLHRLTVQDSTLVLLVCNGCGSCRTRDPAASSRVPVDLQWIG